MRTFASTVFLVLLVLAPADPLTAQTATPIELEAEAFGARVLIEVDGLAEDLATRRVKGAFAVIQELERSVGESVEAANDGAGEQRTVTLEQDVFDLVARAQQFCQWSTGAIGPLGGNVYAHWERAARLPRPPPVPPFAPQSAACDRIAIDAETRTVTLAAGSRLDLRGFARGFAVDRAIGVLSEAGVTSAQVVIGRVGRYLGTPGGTPGGAPPGEDGWRVTLPIFEGYERPLDQLHLSNQSLAIVWQAESVSGTPLYVDLRTGRQDTNSWATLVVSELAIDAQALSVAAFVLGSREGRFRIAPLQPPPSVLWLLGTGQGRPLLTDHHWGDTSTP
jgi:thiamine biosynthesis lipoprotein